MSLRNKSQPALPEQTTLELGLVQEQSFDSFVVGDNRELVDALRNRMRNGNRNGDFVGYWIYGHTFSGRSHLLRASCLHAHREGRRSAYVGGADYPRGSPTLRRSLDYVADHGELVAFDDFEHVCGDSGLEQAIMTIYQRLLQERGTLLIADRRPAAILNFATPDLASRMKSLQHFEVRPLDDEQKARLLHNRAHAKGFELTQAVLSYWLARGPRDVGALLADLDRLDRASLAHKRKVTVPLLKSVLGY